MVAAELDSCEASLTEKFISVDMSATTGNGSVRAKEVFESGILLSRKLYLWEWFTELNHERKITDQFHLLPK